jgi:arsenate reductase
MLDLYWSGHEQVVALCFRDAGKSTLVEETLIIKALIKDFEYAVIVAATERRASDRLLSISNELIKNEIIEEVFGDVRGETWHSTRIILNNGVCIDAIGAGQNARGMKYLNSRPDIVFLDDIENNDVQNDNVSTPEKREDLARWWRAFVPSLAQPHRIILVGTMPPSRRSPRQRGWTPFGCSSRKNQKAFLQASSPASWLCRKTPCLRISPFLPARVWLLESGKVVPSYTAPISPDSAKSRCSFSRITAGVVLTYARRSLPISPIAARERLACMTDRAFNVLILCTGNSARSILAESILRKDGGGRFNAYSAGSHPKGRVNLLALKTLEAYEYPAEGLRSKSWEEFAAPDAPELDFVFTVCDNAAGETCPVWLGLPMTGHWDIQDPAAVEGTAIEKERAFNQAFRCLKNRIAVFIALPIKSLDHLSLAKRLKEIDRMEGASVGGKAGA